MSESDLQKACRMNENKKIEEILRLNPSLLNELDLDFGWSPLYRTIACGHLESSRALLNLGADPDTKNKLGDSPLHKAVENNQISLVQLLLEYQADPNIQQSDGNTPLHYCCIKDYINIATLLLKFKANPNIQEKVFGKTPMHVAAETKNMLIIQLLVKYLARVSIEDFSGHTPIDVYEDIKLLVNHKDADDLSKHTPSFDYSDFSLKTDSMIEPECEHGQIISSGSYSNFSFGVDPHKNSLYKWLTSMKLEFLFNVLYSNGYDDLNFLLAQTRSSDPLTLLILEQIGITKPGHRCKLLALLEQEAFRDLKPSLPMHFIRSPKAGLLPRLDNWLESINLKTLYSSFYDNGYEDMDTLILVMNSSHTLTEESLKTQLGIQDPDHTRAIISKLKQDFASSPAHRRVVSRISIEKDEPIIACDFCVVF